MAKRQDTQKPALALKHKAPKKRKPGRPATLTPEIVHKIGRHFSRGCTLEQSCRIAGVKLGAVEKAMQRKPALREIFDNYKAAFVGDAVDRIYDGSPGWQGAAWLLERRHPGQFGRGQVNITQNTQNNTFSLPEQVIDELGLYAKELNVIEQIDHPKES